jgi:hypothetical protein
MPSDDDNEDPDYNPYSTDSAVSSSRDSPQAEGSNDSAEGDSNGHMHLLNLAALTVQRDTPTRPTDAIAAAVQTTGLTQLKTLTSLSIQICLSKTTLQKA